LYKKYLTYGILVILLWGFFFLLFRSSFTSLGGQFLWSLAYASFISLAVFSVNQLFISKLLAYRMSVQIFLKAILYVIAILIAFLTVFSLRTFLTVSMQSTADSVLPNLFGGIAALLSAPIRGMQIQQIIPMPVISILVSLFILILLIAIFSIVISLVDTQWRQIQFQKKMQEARLKILEMQMQPHFLFNTLNMIVSVLANDAPKAEQLLVQLSDFLRFNFTLADRQEITLKEELEFISNYLTLIKARFGEKVIWKIEADAQCSEYKIPTMLFQPVLENVFKHGWSEDHLQLKIIIRCKVTDHKILLEINDNGNGFDPKRLQGFPKEGHSLQNLQNRLQLRYGSNNLLQINSEPGQGTRVLIEIPEKKL